MAFFAGIAPTSSRQSSSQYANEYAFRYNHRKDEAPMFRTISGQVRKVRSGRYGTYSPLG